MIESPWIETRDLLLHLDIFPEETKPEISDRHKIVINHPDNLDIASLVKKMQQHGYYGLRYKLEGPEQVRVVIKDSQEPRIPMLLDIAITINSRFGLVITEVLSYRFFSPDGESRRFSSFTSLMGFVKSSRKNARIANEIKVLGAS